MASHLGAGHDSETERLEADLFGDYSDSEHGSQKSGSSKNSSEGAKHSSVVASSDTAADKGEAEVDMRRKKVHT